MRLLGKLRRCVVSLEELTTFAHGPLFPGPAGRTARSSLHFEQARDFYITGVIVETNPSMPLNKVREKWKSGPVLMRPDRKRC
jgi:hypothetical protein